MQRNIYIFLRLPDNHRIVVGRLLYEKRADGTIQSYFRYEAAWISQPNSFPLDPINLPLGPDVFQLKSRTGLWGVLEDALPDAWGRRLLQARRQLDVSSSNNIEILLLTGWAEPGATGFARTDEMPGYPVTPMDMDMTDQAITASEKFEKNSRAKNLPDFFISGGSSAGGARPKVLARSGEDLYLVKFPSINDPAPEVMAALEFFGLSCVQRSNVPVPEFHLVKTSRKRAALAIKRFDTTDKKGRYHFLSFQSLVGIEEQLGLPYSKMADIIKKVSVAPEQDLQNLYKQMVINVIICNCDDHLKNFSMMYGNKTAGFRLTPAYDVVPNLWQREHILSVGGRTGDIDQNNLLDEGKRFSISRQRCRKLINEAARGVAEALTDNSDILINLSAAYPLCRRLLETIQENLDVLTTAKDTGQP